MPVALYKKEVKIAGENKSKKHPIVAIASKVEPIIFLFFDSPRVVIIPEETNFSNFSKQKKNKQIHLIAQ
jgi:hypothetical protein